MTKEVTHTDPRFLVLHESAHKAFLHLHNKATPKENGLGMMQDECAGLSRWLSTRIDSKIVYMKEVEYGTDSEWASNR